MASTLTERKKYNNYKSQTKILKREQFGNPKCHEKLKIKHRKYFDRRPIYKKLTRKNEKLYLGNFNTRKFLLGHKKLIKKTAEGLILKKLPGE